MCTSNANQKKKTQVLGFGTLFLARFSWHSRETARFRPRISGSNGFWWLGQPPVALMFVLLVQLLCHCSDLQAWTPWMLKSGKFGHEGALQPTTIWEDWKSHVKLWHMLWKLSRHGIYASAHSPWSTRGRCRQTGVHSGSASSESDPLTGRRISLFTSSAVT